MNSFKIALVTADSRRFVVVRLPDDLMIDEFRLGFIAADAERAFPATTAVILGEPSGALFGHPSSLAALRLFDVDLVDWRPWSSEH